MGLFDADLALLNDSDISRVVIAGGRCEDFRLALLFAGVDERKIVTRQDRRDAADAILLEEGPETIAILYSLLLGAHFTHSHQASLRAIGKGGTMRVEIMYGELANLLGEHGTQNLLARTFGESNIVRTAFPKRPEFLGG